MIIGIDGTTASGKGEIAKAISREFGYKWLDTGAILRGAAVAFIEQKLDSEDENVVNEFIEKLNLEVTFEDGKQKILINGIDKTHLLRTETVSQMTSRLCAYPNFLNLKNPVTRKFAEDNDCVVDGRDICTYVLPNADVKFFFKADPRVRAKRRLAQLLNAGQNVTLEEVYADLLKRDERDIGRKVSPLKPAEDSIIIDNTNQTQKETEQICFSIIRRKINEKLKK